MDAQIRKQIIAQEWMIDANQPLPMLSRLKYRNTYSETTLWWLVVQLDLLDKTSSMSRLHQINIDPQ